MFVYFRSYPQFWIQLELHESKTARVIEHVFLEFWIQLELHESKTEKVK